MAVVPTSSGLPPIRACLFDLDGLLINSEDLLTEARNSVLYEYYSHPPMDWTVKAQLQGRSATESSRILYEWAGLPLTGITIEEFRGKLNARLHEMFKKTGLMPGAGELLRRLSRAKTRRVGEGQGQGQGQGRVVEMALATSSQTAMYKLKTAHLEGEGGVLGLIPEKHKILGDDARLKDGRGKPAPDIFLHALEAINEGLREKGDMEREIKPVECLVFEDAVAGVEAARRAGMRVVWVPDPGLRELYRGQEGEVLAGMTGERRGKDDGQVGEVGEGWGELLSSLEDFEYEKYGIVVEDK
ncbi:hypothetical protein LTR96_009040 [Exophiala xenobiotica]|nr:hypothetical protein LTR96_009040 [Exophiala xenobiotica]KAK5334456.1 hypothetical protein LTR98_009410 [Exophiala xenobiotica]